jgi:spore cortex formation protein SpoVR/YcgB (stage V sporulation)
MCITDIDDGILQLSHVSANIGTLDIKHLEKTLEYIYEIWQNPINVETLDEDGTVTHFTIDELGFSE